MDEEQKNESTQEEKPVKKVKKQFKEWFKSLTPLQQKLLIGGVTVFVLAYFIIGFASIPKIKTGYAKTPITVQTETNNSVRYEISDPIEIADSSDETLYKVYKDGRNIGTVKREDIVFENTPEYEQAKKDRADYENLKKQIEEELQKERDLALKGMEETFNKVFYKIKLKPDHLIYDFYINPISWYSLQFDQKKQLFVNCTIYTAAKFNIDKSKAEVGVKIRSSANEEVLAEYSAFSGIKIK